MKVRTLLKGFSALNLILLFVGGLVMGMTVKEGKIFQLLKPAHDYDYVLDHGLNEGDHIKGEIYYTLGQFASKSTYTKYEDYQTAPKVSGYYYVIPVGEAGFAAIYVSKDNRPLMETVADETYDYLTNGTPIQSSLPFNGVAIKMENELKGLESSFKEQLKDWDYTDAEIEEMLKSSDGKFLVLQGPADVTIVYGMGAVGLVMFGLGIFFYIRRYKKQKAWEEKREEEWTQI